MSKLLELINNELYLMRLLNHKAVVNHLVAMIMTIFTACCIIVCCSNSNTSFSVMSMSELDKDMATTLCSNLTSEMSMMSRKRNFKCDFCELAQTTPSI